MMNIFNKKTDVNKYQILTYFRSIDNNPGTYIMLQLGGNTDETKEITKGCNFVNDSFKPIESTHILEDAQSNDFNDIIANIIKIYKLTREDIQNDNIIIYINIFSNAKKAERFIGNSRYDNTLPERMNNFIIYNNRDNKCRWTIIDSKYRRDNINENIH